MWNLCSCPEHEVTKNIYKTVEFAGQLGSTIITGFGRPKIDRYQRDYLSGGYLHVRLFDCT